MKVSILSPDQPEVLELAHATTDLLDWIERSRPDGLFKNVPRRGINAASSAMEHNHQVEAAIARTQAAVDAVINGRFRELEREHKKTTCACGTHTWPDDCVQIEDSRGRLHTQRGCQPASSLTKTAERPVCRKCGGPHWVGAHDTGDVQGEAQ